MSNGFGRWLERYMGRENLNASGLAKKLRRSHVTVGAWLRGEGGLSDESIRRLSALTNTPVEEIYRMLADSDSPPPADPEADRLLHIYRRLAAEHQVTLLMIAAGLLEQQQRTTEGK